MKIKGSDIFRLFNSLQSMEHEKMNFKLSYTIAKTMRAIRPEIEDIQKAVEPDKAFLDYEKVRIELCKEHAKKDGTGKPVIVGNSYIFDDQKAFDLAVGKLRENHLRAITDHEAKIKDYQSRLSDQIEINLHRIDVKDLPGEMSPNVMEGLLPILCGMEEADGLG